MGSLRGLPVMAIVRYLGSISGLLLLLLSASAAYAECGGATQCIAVGLTAADARIAHHGGAPNPQPTLTFANQQALTTSASQTVFVAAVTGPAGTMAILGALSISGANASEFSITGGTCSPANGPIQDASGGGGTLCTITVAFQPTSAGAKSALLNVPLNPVCAGCITGRAVNLAGTGTPSVTGPTAGPATMSVPVNTPTSLNLLPFTAGGATAVSVAATGAGAPTRGTVSVSGTTVTYTPSKDYFGSDTFTYSASNAGGSSALATVTVTITGRPDPSQDATVRGLVRAQAETARRFINAQMSNVQRRLESLHLGSGGGGSASAGSTTGTGFTARSDPFALQGGIAQLASLAPALGNAGSQNAPFRDVARDPFALASVDLARNPNIPNYGAVTANPLMPPSYVTALAGAVSSGTLNLSALGRADGLGADSTGIWMGGNIGFGTRDLSASSSGYRFVTDGVTVGLDHRFNNQLAMGVSAGVAHDRTSVAPDGSGYNAKGYSFSLYGSYQPARNWYVDGLLGYGVVNYDSLRYVAPATAYARAERKGNSWFSSVTTGYEHRADGLLFAPYGRVELGQSELKQATETGAGLFSLTYDTQRLRSLNLALGARIEAAHRTAFGWAMPRARLEYKHHFTHDETALLGYADQPAGPRYGVTGLTNVRGSLLAGLGTDFLLRDGFKIGVDYQLQRAMGGERGHGLRVWLSKDLDGKGGMPQGLTEWQLPAEPVRLEAGVMWDDNLNRARLTSEKLSDRIYSLTASKRITFPMTEQTRATVSGFVTGDKALTYTGLDRVAGGVVGELQYRTSADFDAFTLGLQGRAAYEDFNSGIRTGTRYSMGLNARTSLTDRIDVFTAVTRNFRDARNLVFDGRDTSARFNLDYAAVQRGSLYFGGEFRRGDLVTSVPVSLAYAALGKASTPDDAYGLPGIQAYRYDARTRIWNVGFNYALGPRDSIDISWRQATSTPTAQVTNPLYSSGGTSYRAVQYSLAYLLRF